MRLSSLLFFLSVSWQCVLAQQQVQIKYSKPFAIIKFLETTKGVHSTSITFKHQIDTSLISKDPKFMGLVAEYKTLNLDYNYSKDQYPQKRKRTTSTWDLLCIAAISANSNEEFFNKIIGIFPNTDYLKLKRIVSQTEPYYDRFIYSSRKSVIDDRVRELSGLSPKLNDLFDKFKVFYGSSWDKTMPFNLTIYPIYGMRGQTTATPHANSLEMGFLTQEDNNFDLLSVGSHEMCHVLFEEQPLALQQQLDSSFTNTTDPYGKYAYRYIDEALATALGNGFGYNYLAGELDSGEWYNDKYINLYAKAIYPLATQYVNEGKQIDKAFAFKCIELFRQTFPNAIYDFDPLLMSCDIYFEEDASRPIDDYNSLLHNTFRIYSSNMSIPVLDPISLENIKTSELPQLIILHKNQAAVMAKMKTLFKNLISLPDQKNMLISFLDKDKRAVIILVAENDAKIKEGIKLMKTQKEINPKKLFVAF
jgi:hypothetical protein